MTQKAKYRTALPQLAGHTLLTDSGLETTLIFHDGIDLPCFASFPLLDTVRGRQRLKDYYLEHARIALKAGTGFVLETPTWRASRDWGAKLSYDEAALEAVNRDAVDLMLEIREAFETEGQPFVISGNLGPRGDGYVVGKAMSAVEAQAYHAPQIRTLADAGADLISIFTVNYAEEAIGAVRAAQALDVPIAVSFTVETDGRLPTEQSLAEAIAQTDRETSNGPAYYMVNCAHPTHFLGVVAEGNGWRERIAGIRANASKLSHAELDEAEELDDGDPLAFGGEYAELQRLLPNLRVLGGCCGTDHRHVEAVGHTCVGHAHAA